MSFLFMVNKLNFRSVPNFCYKSTENRSERDDCWIHLKLNLQWESGKIWIQLFSITKIKFILISFERIFRLFSCSTFAYTIHKSIEKCRKFLYYSIRFKWMKFYLPMVNVLKSQMQIMPLPLMWLLRIAFSRKSPNIFD